MKQLLLYLLMLTGYSTVAQNDFTGTVKYKMTVDGSDKPATDSMTIVFDKQKIKVILYLPDAKSGLIAEKIFIDDLVAKKSLVADKENKTYRSDTLRTTAKYNFINTHSIAASSNNLLCFLYRADSTKLDRTLTSGVECLASINHRNSAVYNYSFLGIQPVIIDNRIVMDFVVIQPGGVKQRTYVSGITPSDTVNEFDLEGYRQVR